jgi:hypothetical protein
MSTILPQRIDRRVVRVLRGGGIADEQACAT